MEIRVLRYFLEIAREENMSRAAERLHVSQPTLSKQMKDLEQELGKKLFRRSSASIHLTDEGKLLRKRAEDILSMVDKTQEEFQSLTEVTGGDVHIGCAESVGMRHLARVISCFQQRYPGFRYHLYSGDTEPIAERLDRGLLDFGVIAEPPDLSRCHSIELPGKDLWGAVLRRDHPLSAKSCITPEDLSGVSLLCSRQALKADIPRWCREKADHLNVTGSLDLSFNGGVFAAEGLGIVLTFKGILNTGPESPLCFRPLQPSLETSLYFIWRRYQVFSPIAERFLEAVQDAFPGR